MEIIKEEDWTFAQADTQYMTHGLHPYPARMIPQIAQRLITRYSSKGSNVLDPFCGSGTVLVESRLAGRNCIGIDINPLALLLAKAKTTPLEPKSLISIWKSLKTNIEKDIVQLRWGISDVKPLEIKEIDLDYWFKPKVQKELTIIRYHLDKLKESNEEYYYFFATCFSYTVRKSSNLRSDEFKIFRIPKDKLSEHNPDAYAIFVDWIERNIPKMAEYYNAVDKSTKCELKLEDSRRLSIPDEEVDLMATSPPYGDSKTTVAYGQFSRFSSFWLGLPSELVLKVDKHSLGGIQRSAKKDLHSDTLAQVLEEISRKAHERAKDVEAYFADFHECLKQIARVLKHGGHACFVVGNRTVKRIRIPTDRIIIELGNSLGLEKIALYYRRIPSKRMPWKNAPENVAGMKSETIANESIIILKKP